MLVHLRLDRRRTELIANHLAMTNAHRVVQGVALIDQPGEF